ncbi:MAG: PD40 domain-containing protein [Flavobacteriales bacterium]|nr:PD40 domain-containing protein [Flavobacteriales bacterium]
MKAILKIRSFHLLLLFLFFAGNFYAQKYLQDKDFQKAEKLFYKGNYNDALPTLLKLDSTYNEEMIDFLIGMSYMQQKSMENEAIPYLEKYVSNSDSLDQAHYYLAQLYHWNYHFDEAIEMYDRFLNIALSKTNDTIINQLISETVNKRIEECNFGKISVSSPRKVIIENLGNQVNSEYPEYAPVISKDEKTLIFTSRRPGSTGEKLDHAGQFFEDIYLSHLLKGGLFEEDRLDSLLSGGGYITLLTDFIYSSPQPM